MIMAIMVVDMMMAIMFVVVRYVGDDGPRSMMMVMMMVNE